MLGIIVLGVAIATRLEWCTPLVLLALAGILFVTIVSIRDPQGLIHTKRVAEAYSGCGMALGTHLWRRSWFLRLLRCCVWP